MSEPWRQLQALTDLTTPWAVRVVATLRIPDLIASGVTGLEELAGRCGADAETLGRVMRYLVARGVFAEPAPGRFTTTPVGRLLEDAAGVRGWLDQDGFGGRMDRAWPGLLETVRSGKTSYEHVFGLSLWDDLVAHPEVAASFNALMARQSEDVWRELSQVYDWSRAREVVDVGGGSGILLAALAHAVPHIRGTVVELPPTARAAAERFAREGLADRCGAQGGSMFDPLPRGADLYLVAIVIGDWIDEKATAILRRCAEAVDPGGRVLIVEAVLDETLAGSFAMDLIMLTISEGRARTLAQLRAIIQAAGLELVQTCPMPSGRYALECALPGHLS